MVVENGSQTLARCATLKKVGAMGRVNAGPSQSSTAMLTHVSEMGDGEDGIQHLPLFAMLVACGKRVVSSLSLTGKIVHQRPKVAKSPFPNIILFPLKHG